MKISWSDSLSVGPAPPIVVPSSLVRCASRSSTERRRAPWIVRSGVFSVSMKPIEPPAGGGGTGAPPPAASAPGLAPRSLRLRLPTFAVTQTSSSACTAERTCAAVVAVVAPATHPEGGGGGGGSLSSTAHIHTAGVGSVLPDGSVARTEKVWPPTARPAYDLPEPKEANSAASSLHSKLEPDSLEPKEKPAEVVVVVAGGPPEMGVSGGVVSGGGGGVGGWWGRWVGRHREGLPARVAVAAGAEDDQAHVFRARLAEGVLDQAAGLFVEDGPAWPLEPPRASDTGGAGAVERHRYADMGAARCRPDGAGGRGWVRSRGQAARVDRDRGVGLGWAGIDAGRRLRPSPTPSPSLAARRGLVLVRLTSTRSERPSPSLSARRGLVLVRLTSLQLERPSRSASPRGGSLASARPGRAIRATKAAIKAPR